VQRVETADGEVLYDSNLSVERVCAEPDFDLDTAPALLPAAALRDGLIQQASDLFPWPLGCAEQVESPQRIYLIADVMKQVVRRGSGVAAGRAFEGRDDLFGKTGTTNGPRDAWFAGGNADIVSVAWVGFDTDARELGGGEQGGRTAIPAWIELMKVALAGMPERGLPRPPGIVDLRIVQETGLIAADCRRDFSWELFVEENQPEREPETVCFGSNAEPLSTDPGENPGVSSDSSSGRLFQ
jgi:penicillin-binding protein 1A